MLAMEAYRLLGDGDIMSYAGITWSSLSGYTDFEFDVIRLRVSARLVRDLTVPVVTPSAAAVSASPSARE
jgi:uncharacterized protein YraI